MLYLNKLYNQVKRDFKRHGSSFRELQFYAMANYRFGRWVWTLPKPMDRVGGKVYGAFQLAIEVATGIVVHRETDIGDDFHLVHSGNIKIHPMAKIGNNCGFMQNVTIGQASCKKGARGYPIIGNNVFVGVGAAILGGVTVGDGATIAANSLVITDVASGETVMGVPAIPMRHAMKPLFQARTDDRTPKAVPDYQEEQKAG